MTTTIDRPRDRTKDGNTTTFGSSQVVLYNDDVNPFEYVVSAVMSVFGHAEPVARKVTMEAHTRGRAVAEVEDEENARKHAAELGAFGLRAEVEGF